MKLITLKKQGNRFNPESLCMTLLNSRVGSDARVVARRGSACPAPTLVSPRSYAWSRDRYPRGEAPGSEANWTRWLSLLDITSILSKNVDKLNDHRK
jgi:hypothetical protein